MEVWESSLVNIVNVLKYGFEAVSVICIFLGFIAFTRQVFLQPERLYYPPFFDLRLILGSWFALGLEFQIGADILGTTLAPSFGALGKLGAITLIRTFLNYFLDKELDSEVKWKNTSTSQSSSSDE